MATLKVDSDGVVYWDQPLGSRWDYTVNWSAWVAAASAGNTVTSATWSSDTSGATVTSGAVTSAGRHTGWFQPSAGHAGQTLTFFSKIFAANTTQSRQRLRVKVGTY